MKFRVNASLHSCEQILNATYNNGFCNTKYERSVVFIKNA